MYYQNRKLGYRASGDKFCASPPRVLTSIKKETKNAYSCLFSFIGVGNTKYSANMKLDPKAIRYLNSEDFRVLAAVWPRS